MKTHEVLELLRHYESRNVTFMEPDGSWPIVWERARGIGVRDADGKAYVDLTAAFGVAAAGHANPRVVRAGQRQMARLLHAMGDVHPHELKARLARELSRITFERWRNSLKCSALQMRQGQSARPTSHPAGRRAKTIFCNSGFEAVEAALKTAMLATGKPGVIVFEGAYHGLGYGALNATHRDHFRGPFRSQLRQFGHFLPFPKLPWVSSSAGEPGRTRSRRNLACCSHRTGADRGESAFLGSPAPNAVRILPDDFEESQMERLFQRRKIGAVLVEPVQVRGGINVPPRGFLPLLRGMCDRHKALLIVDEIYTGFGRTGKWFACEHSGVVPDLICLGKALTGGFPLSACVGRADLMDAAWPASLGEAIHTSTFLGHPVGCAMALAQIEEIRRLDLVRRSAELGAVLLDLLKLQIANCRLQISIRGLGLLAGVELLRPNGAPAVAETLDIVKAMLRRGFILLPEGEHANVISFTPPLTIGKNHLARTVTALQQSLQEIAEPQHP